jgi:1-acyl-sn-glycerol-3-phosphate acyltransferase
VKRLRSTIFTIFFYAWTCLLCFLGLFILWLPRRRFMPAVHFWSRYLTHGEELILGLHYQILGKENLPNGACIVAPKHQSAWETCKICELFGDPAIVLKAELTYIPVLKWYANACGLIPIDRDGRVKALAKMVTAAKQAAADGRKIVIFPQGTRTLPGEKKPYKSGVAAIYKALNLPIIPMALNSGMFWPKNGLKKGGLVTIEFLPPIPPGLSREEMMTRLQTELDSASDRLCDNVR